MTISVCAGIKGRARACVGIKIECNYEFCAELDSLSQSGKFKHGFGGCKAFVYGDACIGPFCVGGGSRTIHCPPKEVLCHPRQMVSHWISMAFDIKKINMNDSRYWNEINGVPIESCSLEIRNDATFVNVCPWSRLQKLGIGCLFVAVPALVLPAIAVAFLLNRFFFEATFVFFLFVTFVNSYFLRRQLLIDPVKGVVVRSTVFFLLLHQSQVFVLGGFRSIACFYTIRNQKLTASIHLVGVRRGPRLVTVANNNGTDLALIDDFGAGIAKAAGLQYDGSTRERLFGLGL